MIEHLLTPAQKQVVEDARAFVRDTPRQLILDMDAEQVRFPKDWLREAAKRNYRDIRLASIWTGTNEVMAMIVAHEWYRGASMRKVSPVSTAEEDFDSLRMPFLKYD